MSIPTLTPRDLFPRPGSTLLRFSVSSAIPLLFIVVLLAKGVPPQYLLIVFLFIASQASMALAQAQKEMLAATTSYFHPGLGRRVGRMQAFWGLAVPALATAVYGLITPTATATVLGSVLGLGMMVHVLMTWATLRLWWAFMLPAWAFYFFFVPMAFRRAAVAGWLLDTAQHPAAWLAAGGIGLVVLVRYAASRGLRRQLHGTIVLGPEAIFIPRRVQACKQQRRRHGYAAGGVAWRNGLLARIIARADGARRRGDTTGARTWQLMAADFAVNVSPRPLLVPLVAVAVLAMMVVFGYVQGGGQAFGRVWYPGLVFQAGLFPLYSLAAVLGAVPLSGASRRTGFRAEARAVAAAAAAAAAAALLLKGTAELLAGVLPLLDLDCCRRPFTPGPLHGVWLVPMTAPFAWLAIAIRPRTDCVLPNSFVVLGFFLGHTLMTQVAYRTSVPAFGALALAVGVLAFVLRRRWWRQADLAG